METEAQGAVDFPPELERLVRSELHSGERLVWIGRPSPHAFARRSLVPMVVGLSLVAGAVKVWLSTRDALATPGQLWWLVGTLGYGLAVALLAAAPVLILWPYFAARRASECAYALTDQRCIVFESRPLGALVVESYGPDQLAGLKCVERAGGRGDLILREDPLTLPEGPSRVKTYGFFGIPAVRDVDALVIASLSPRIATPERVVGIDREQWPDELRYWYTELGLIVASDWKRANTCQGILVGKWVSPTRFETYNGKFYETNAPDASGRRQGDVVPVERLKKV